MQSVSAFLLSPKGLVKLTEGGGSVKFNLSQHFFVCQHFMQIWAKLLSSEKLNVRLLYDSWHALVFFLLLLHRSKVCLWCSVILLDLLNIFWVFFDFEIQVLLRQLLKLSAWTKCQVIFGKLKKLKKNKKSKAFGRAIILGYAWFWG